MRETSKPYKIAFLVDSYSRGGVALALQTLLYFLAQEDYAITLFVKNYDAGNMLAMPDNIVCLPWPATSFSLRNKLLRLLHWRNYGRKVVYQARSLQNFPGEFDCAIAYQMISNDVTVATLEKVCAKRKLLWLHGKKNYSDKDLPFYDTLYAQADQIVCVSLDTEIRFQGLMPKCAQKTITIHNLYDVESILRRSKTVAEGMEASKSVPTIVSVGRISAEKGFDRVPAAARRLADEGYDFQWYIVGDGNKKAEIQQDIQEKNVADRVHLLGYRSNPYPYIRNCDIYVQPSYSEGFCTSTMEAKILHKPVVTTDVPGMREQFTDGENGLIVESSVDGIFEGIKRLLDDPQLREKITENLRNEAPHNDKVLAQTKAVIEGRPMEH